MTRDRTSKSQPRAARAEPTALAAAAPPFAQRWYGKALLLLIGVVLLSLSFSPFKQFYMAWFGLVPWLIVLKNCRSPWRAFWWSWLAGTAFFSANMWWLYWVTGPGLVALMIFLGFYWAGAGMVIRGAGLLKALGDGVIGGPGASVEKEGPQASTPRPLTLTPLHPKSSPFRTIFSVLGIATVWTGWEWIRGNWPLQGLAWFYLGHTQTPALYLCQVADLTGDLGVTFWIAMFNAWVALFILNGWSLRQLVPSLAMVLVVMAAVLTYGVWRFGQEAGVTEPGPTVMVVQPNYLQTNTGEKGAKPGEIVAFHMNQSRAGLAKHPEVDLVVWSETMMPPLNPELLAQYTRPPELDRFVIADQDSEKFWKFLYDEQYGAFCHLVRERLNALAQKYNVGFLVGSSFISDFRKNPEGNLYPADKRNSAYYFPKPGSGGEGLRSDKIHLVPFGEYIPFKQSLPWVYRIFIALGPQRLDEYALSPGDVSHLTVFTLTSRWRFVTPICFEDIDGPLVATMFRPRTPQGIGTMQTTPASDSKAADFIVNVTNDGWFRYIQMPQHFQAAQFRSIENRAPTARSVNTGISGFIDSMGRPHDMLAAGTEGISVSRLNLDSRTTFYTRYGEVFARIVAMATGIMAVAGIVRWWMKRRQGRSAASPIL